MKLIFAIVNKDDTDTVVAALNAAGHQATRLSSTGGFLRKGNTTLMIGTEDEAVDRVIDTIEHVCGKRRTIEVVVPYTPSCGQEYRLNTYYDATVKKKVEIGGAIIFVTDVDRYKKI